MEENVIQKLKKVKNFCLQFRVRLQIGGIQYEGREEEVKGLFLSTFCVDSCAELWKNGTEKGKKQNLPLEFWSSWNLVLSPSDLHVLSPPSPSLSPLSSLFSFSLIHFFGSPHDQFLNFPQQPTSTLSLSLSTYRFLGCSFLVCKILPTGIALAALGVLLISRIFVYFPVQITSGV
ncbi:hypothetical protein BT93_E2668 [Corymbia citriodora subsp. variegata]|nr:hypothetical protein BT93_E2668 [Corymbia citriodora subsp. variegata]